MFKMRKTFPKIISKRLLYFFFLFSLVALVKGCTDKPTKPVIFSGITITDEYGNVLAWDPGDWCTYSSFKSSGKLPVPHPKLSDIPKSFNLAPAYPNPTSDSVTIPFALPLNIKVKLWIMNRFGQNVTVLVDSTVYAGYRSAVWHLQDSHSRRVSSGIYKAVFEAGGFVCDGDIWVE